MPTGARRVPRKEWSRPRRLRASPKPVGQCQNWDNDDAQRWMFLWGSSD
jgi:hypothetical protein